ncbi:MAG: hypothetical protein K1X79_06600 [Oligoflexia bacterium]|nr:hypothetical protein [Oligoflexia bacterium]
MNQLEVKSLSQHSSLALVALVLATFAFAMFLPAPIGDDPYIYARMSRNILSGLGWTFNSGERLDLATSPLYLVLFTLINWGGGETLAFKLLHAASTAGIAALSLLLLRRQSCPFNLSILTAALAALFPPLLDWYGLETPLFLFLVLWAVWAWDGNKSELAFWLCGLGFFARPEALSLGLIFFVLHYVRHRQPPHPRVLSRLLSLPCCGAVLHLWYFGSFFPHTSTAKVAQGMSRFWDSLLGAVIVWFQSYPLLYLKLSVLVLLLLSLCGLGLAWKRKHDGLAALGLFSLFHLFAYNTLGVAFYPWYLACEGLALLLLSAFALSRILIGRSRAGFSLLVLSALTLPLCQPRIFNLMPVPNSRVGYEQIAKQVSPFLRPGATLLSVEIGVLGWALPEQVVADTVGLTGWLPLDRVAQGNFGAWIEDRQLPEAVLVVKRFQSLIEPRAGDQREKFEEHYQLSYSGQASIPGFEFELFSRKPHLR